MGAERRCQTIVHAHPTDVRDDTQSVSVLLNYTATGKLQQPLFRCRSLSQAWRKL